MIRRGCWRAIIAAATLVFANADAAEVVKATAAALKGDAKATTFELSISEGVTAEVFTLANPYRVIVDLPDVDFKLSPEAGQSGQGLISAYRYGLFAERKARVVIDTTGPVRIARAEMARPNSSSGVVLAITLEAMDAAAFGDGTGATRAAAAKHGPEDAATEPKPKTTSKPVVVIDAGHGGIDPGATGGGVVAEKTVVLAVALALKDALTAAGRYDVRMTRSTDVFVSLDRRLKISEDADADLFISLHADSIAEMNFAQNIRGATIYTLSEKASDEQARLIAEKENASDLIAGLEASQSAAYDQVKNILIDLMKRETKNFSTDFSNVLASRLGKTIAMSRDPQRSAAFKVLKQTHAPSVLIELGYMSNSQDQQQMLTEAWQTKVAAAVAAAVQSYFDKRTAKDP
ncbi:MAG: N-acetylmuramoyl-L-alanine amidase [Hyphomicrobium sp.]